MRGLVMALLARDVPGSADALQQRAGRFAVPFQSAINSGTTKTITKKTTAKTV